MDLISTASDRINKPGTELITKTMDKVDDINDKVNDKVDDTLNALDTEVSSLAEQSAGGYQYNVDLVPNIIKKMYNSKAIYHGSRFINN